MTLSQAERTRLPFGRRKGEYLGDIAADDWEYFVYLTGLKTYGPVQEALALLLEAHRDKSNSLQPINQSTFRLE